MTCYETICTIIQILGFVILAIMIYSIKAKERTDEEEAKRVSDAQFARVHYKTMEQVYQHEAEEYRCWFHFAIKYGCRTPTEMQVLIDDLIAKIRKLEVK